MSGHTATHRVLIVAGREQDLPRTGEQHFVEDGHGGWLELLDRQESKPRSAWFHARSIAPDAVVDARTPGRGRECSFTVRDVMRLEGGAS